MNIRQQGQLLQADFFSNTGGLNVSDSPFAVGDDQATGGNNFDYIRTGGFRKRYGHEKVNDAANAVTQTLGVHLYNTTAAAKTVIRATDTQIQVVDLSAESFTALTEDTTAAGSTFASSGSEVAIVGSQFNTATTDVLWLAGGGMASLYGVYSTSKITKNGVPAPTGTISSNVTLTGGSFASTGAYKYAVAFRKTGTQALSNAALDISATVANTTDTVTITLSSISNVDTTKYDKIYLYRSAVGGSSSFTTGDLVAMINTGTATYADTGTSTTSSTNVPRAANTTLDNSELATATYKVVTTYKRRLVTASNSTLYLSDLNKPESWPTGNVITVPSGGNITALGVISFVTPTTSAIDEILVIFKERELWVLTGDTLSDWSLKFIDNVGCPAQAVVTTANGYLGWLDNRGIYLWDGSGKPIYCSRPIEALFQDDGDIDKSKLTQAWAQFSRKNNQIIWCLSHKAYGENKFQIKLDLRLTLPRVGQNLMGRIVEGVFTTDYTTFSLYNGTSLIPPSETDEALISGDDSGYLYRLYKGHSDASSGISFTYETKFLDFGTPGTAKRATKVIAWVDNIGDWKLYLDYWSQYRTAAADKSSREQVINVANVSNIALWNVGYWDQAYWDDYTSKIVGLVFNLDGHNNNNEGDCFKFRFRQESADNPVTINGFSVIYSELPVRK